MALQGNSLEVLCLGIVMMRTAMEKLRPALIRDAKELHG